MEDASAESVARFLLRRVVWRHGPPNGIHTDRGKENCNAIVEAITAKLGAVHTLSTAFHHQSNGRVERWHRTFKDAIAKVVANYQRDWVDHLDAVVFAYNVTPHSATAVEPFRLMTGAQPRMDIDVALQQPASSYASARSNIRDVAAQLSRLVESGLELARKHDAASHEVAKRYYDDGRREADFQVGQRVMLLDPSFRSRAGQRRKLVRPWHGPYRITAMPSKLVARIRLDAYENAAEQEVSVQRLKHFVQRVSGASEAQSAAETDEEVEVDSIEEERVNEEDSSRVEFRVTPKNQPLSHGFWVSEDEMQAGELLANWRRHHPRATPLAQPSDRVEEQGEAPNDNKLSTKAVQTRVIPQKVATSNAAADRTHRAPTTHTRSGRAVFSPSKLSLLTVTA